VNAPYRAALEQLYGSEEKEGQWIQVPEEVDEAVCSHYHLDIDVTQTARRPLYHETTVSLEPVEGLSGLRAGQCPVCLSLYYHIQLPG
jgi:hypothetical protein